MPVKVIFSEGDVLLPDRRNEDGLKFVLSLMNNEHCSKPRTFNLENEKDG